MEARFPTPETNASEQEIGAALNLQLLGAGRQSFQLGSRSYDDALVFAPAPGVTASTLRVRSTSAWDCRLYNEKLSPSFSSSEASQVDNCADIKPLNPFTPPLCRDNVKDRVAGAALEISASSTGGVYPGGRVRVVIVRGFLGDPSASLGDYFAHHLDDYTKHHCYEIRDLLTKKAYVSPPVINEERANDWVNLNMTQESVYNDLRVAIGSNPTWNAGSEQGELDIRALTLVRGATDLLPTPFGVVGVFAERLTADVSITVRTVVHHETIPSAIVEGSAVPHGANSSHHGFLQDAVHAVKDTVVHGGEALMGGAKSAIGSAGQAMSGVLHQVGEGFTHSVSNWVQNKIWGAISRGGASGSMRAIGNRIAPLAIADGLLL
jgi:hypothetical protein